MSKIKRLDKIAKEINPWDPHTIEHCRSERRRTAILMEEVELTNAQRDTVETLCEHYPDLTAIIATMMCQAIGKSEGP